MQQCTLIFFLNHDKVNSEETIGAAISDLVREKPSSRKALQECVATGSRALMEGTWGGRRRRQQDRTRGILFNKKKETTFPSEKTRRS